MSDPALIELIKTIGTLLGVALTAFLTYKTVKLSKKIDGRMDELIESKKAEGKAEGVEQEKSRK